MQTNKLRTIDLQNWSIKNEPSKEMFFHIYYWNQILFVRDRLTAVFGSIVDGRGLINVVGTHVSKSIVLPVYQIEVKELGLLLTMRGNFYDWKVSVLSKTPIVCDFMNLIDGSKKWSSHYCEGFKNEQIFGSYNENKREFTVEISDDFSLYTFIWLLVRHLKSIQVETKERSYRRE
ncbi:hypothetical protein NDS46_30055 (plasmid) [Paenibacillus thiaminolyticus]|uniref:hypothetical protein n=1 Tax=Paenibacillus thiaminolyticus TaxID=49283 RepID=UPI00232B8895|nr:hypothetical protein [Paenibacillus thiaminolyticus]WCF11591.1 hypothetical protein NDS46_30055 [Paenibacillus thiaminolyticus]